MIKHQKRSTARTARLLSSLIKSPVNSSGTGLNIKILPLLMKLKCITRSLRITNSRSRKHPIIGSRRVLVSQAVVCEWRHRFCDALQLTGLLGSGLSQFAWLLQSVFGQPPTYRLCANGPYFAGYLLTNLSFLYVRVSQEKREPYAVHFVSANKHAPVLSQICRTSYTILHQISQIRIFSYCLQISENILNFWRGVYFKVKNHEHFNDYFCCCFFISDLLRNILKCNCSP